MKRKTLIFALLIFFPSAAKSFFDKPVVNGGFSCAVCTVLTSVAQQLAEVHNETVVDAFRRLCDYMPAKFEHPCIITADIVGLLFLHVFEDHVNPDEACHAMGFCYTQPGLPQCKLFPRRKHKITVESQKFRKVKDFIRNHFRRYGINWLFPSICEFPGVKRLCELYENIFHKHIPGLDIDSDGHSTIETLRGTSWKGRDCDDLKASIRPGSRPVKSDTEEDSNCNGIYGVDNKGQSYEDLFCKNSGQKGMIILGDSASAHFHIPYQWFSPKHMNKDIFTHLPFALENECDWPMMSAYTGYINITWPITPGTVHSFYWKMRERNRCNHRDYQNIGVNGAQSFSVLKNQKRLTRNATTDQPVVLMVSLIGNDVCNAWPDAETEAHMTTPDQMRINLLQLLEYVKDKLPMGSNVLLMGMADARLFVESLLDRYHPMGTLRQDIKYRDVYSWFSCLHVSPCTGWLNANATIRNITTERAQQLTAVIQQIAKEFHHHYKNFDINFVEFPVNTVARMWIAKHGKDSLWQLIEPVDGFHPNQYANAMAADVMWDHAMKHFPHILGDINPHNQQIQDIFGDQGGH